MKAQVIRSTFILLKGSLVPLKSHIAKKRKSNNKTTLVRDEIEQTYKEDEIKKCTEKKS